MLVQRWQILQLALPKGFTIKRSIALVNALAKLHNCCVGQRIEQISGVPQMFPCDRFCTNYIRGKNITLDAVEDGIGPIPTQLLGGSEH